MKDLKQEILDQVHTKFGLPLTEPAKVQMEGNGDTLLISYKELLTFLSTSIDKVEANLLSRLKERVEKLVVYTPEQVAELNKDLDSRTQQDLYSSAIGYKDAIDKVLSLFQEEGLKKVELNEWQDKDGVIRRGGIS